MPNCSINGCKTSSTNAKERQLKLFSFPKNLDVRKKWTAACKKPYKFNENNARICSKHFPEDAFEKPMIQRMLNYSPTNSRKLRSDAVPTQYLPPFAETEVKIETLCNEIENIPIDEIEVDEGTEQLNHEETSNDQPSESSSDTKTETLTLPEKEPKKSNRDARIAYETLLSTYQKFFTENEELKLKNKALKIECEKHRKLYEKRLQENIKLRQRNRVLLNENQKYRNRLRKFERNIADLSNGVMECEVYDEIEQEDSDGKSNEIR